MSHSEATWCYLLIKIKNKNKITCLINENYLKNWNRLEQSIQINFTFTKVKSLFVTKNFFYLSFNKVFNSWNSTSIINILFFCFPEVWKSQNSFRSIDDQSQMFHLDFQDLENIYISVYDIYGLFSYRQEFYFILQLHIHFLLRNAKVN